MFKSIVEAVFHYAETKPEAFCLADDNVSVTYKEYALKFACGREGKAAQLSFDALKVGDKAKAVATYVDEDYLGEYAAITETPYGKGKIIVLGCLPDSQTLTMYMTYLASTVGITPIAEYTENHIHYAKRFRNRDFKIRNTVDAISHATCGMAIDIDAKAIAVCSRTGITARMVSRFRSPVDILGITTDEKTWHKLSLSWGVIPLMCEEVPSTDVLFYTALKLAKKAVPLKSGDKIVITGGVTNGKSGNTNLIKVETI